MPDTGLFSVPFLRHNPLLAKGFNIRPPLSTIPVDTQGLDATWKLWIFPTWKLKSYIPLP